MLCNAVLALMVMVLMLLLSREVAGGRCKPYRGDVGFNIKNTGPCITEKLKENVYVFKSPGYPNNYPDKIYCEAEMSTKGPRYLVVRPRQFDVVEKDRVTLRFPFRDVHRFTEDDIGKNIYSPSSSAVLKFRTSAKNNDKGFVIKIRAKKSRCQQVCDLSSGDSGFLEIQNYAPDTFCEWWMEAPEGCTIQLQFLNFNVGQAPAPGTRDCSGDYLAVSRRGNQAYAKPKSLSHCGRSLPTDTSSLANKINVLFNGEDGGRGFKIEYTVQCPLLLQVSTTTTSPTTTSTIDTSTKSASTTTSTTSLSTSTSDTTPSTTVLPITTNTDDLSTSATTTTISTTTTDATSTTNAASSTPTTTSSASVT